MNGSVQTEKGKKMTRDDAINELKCAIDLIKQDGKDWLDERDIPLLQMAIEALETATPRPNDNLINFGDIGSPTIKPLERKRGKWIRTVLGSTSGYGTTVMYQCSECEKMAISKYHYCPNCGARMDGEKDVD